MSEYNQVVIYSTANYDSYEEAKAVGAVYETGSTIDAVSQELGSGFYDLMEVTSEIEKCLGVVGELEYGILNDAGDFVSFEQLIEAIEKKNRNEALSSISEVTP